MNTDERSLLIQAYQMNRDEIVNLQDTILSRYVPICLAGAGTVILALLNNKSIEKTLGSLSFESFWLAWLSLFVLGAFYSILVLGITRTTVRLGFENRLLEIQVNLPGLCYEKTNFLPKTEACWPIKLLLWILPHACEEVRQHSGRETRTIDIAGTPFTEDASRSSDKIDCVNSPCRKTVNENIQGMDTTYVHAQVIVIDGGIFVADLLFCLVLASVTHWSPKTPAININSISMWAIFITCLGVIIGLQHGFCRLYKG